MKRILNLTVFALAAFVLLGSVSAMATDRPFALNAKGVAIFIVDEAGNLIGGDVTSTGNATHLRSSCGRHSCQAQRSNSFGSRVDSIADRPLTNLGNPSLQIR